MPKNMTELFAKMDDQFWFRMIVCFLPGLILLKLSSYAATGSILNTLAAAVLIAGIAFYAFWSRLRGMSANSEDGAADVDDIAHDAHSFSAYESAGAAAADQITMLKELRAMCGEAESMSLQLIEIEIAVNPELSLTEAIRSASARHQLTKRP